MTVKRAIAMFLVVASLMACRGQVSEKPPIHLNPNMDTQQKYKPQSRSKFFSDGRTMRMPVPGTVARGQLREDDRYHRGKVGADFVKTIPATVDLALLQRGQERFDIYCAPCHDKVGSGKGIVVASGLVPPPTYHSDRIRAMPVGQLFDIVTNGVRTMPSYRYQVPEADRWAIVAYVKALQRSQLASLNDIPEQQRTAVQ